MRKIMITLELPETQDLKPSLATYQREAAKIASSINKQIETQICATETALTDAILREMIITGLAFDAVGDAYQHTALDYFKKYGV